MGSGSAVKVWFCKIKASLNVLNITHNLTQSDGKTILYRSVETLEKVKSNNLIFLFLDKPRCS